MSDDRFSGEDQAELTPGERVYRGPPGAKPNLGPPPQAKRREPDWAAMRRQQGRPTADEIAEFTDWFGRTFGCRPAAVEDGRDELDGAKP